MRQRTEEFLNKYRQLEAAVAAEHGLSASDSAMSFLQRRREYRELREELDYCREVRNLLTHNPRLGESYAVVPTAQMLDLLDRVLDRVRNPKRARDLMVPRDRVVCRQWQDPVLSALDEMRRGNFTHIPILRDGAVAGAFSENSLLCCILDGRSLHAGTRFSDLADYLPLERHRAEAYRFIPPDTRATEIEDIFGQALKRQERIGLLFVTALGKPENQLLGIISPWDAAAIE